MEEIVNPNVEQKPREDVVETKVKGKNNPLLIILLIFFIILFTALVYMFFTDKLIIVGLENPFSSNIEQEVEVEEEEGKTQEEGEDENAEEHEDEDITEEEEDLLAYRSDERIGISFKYPDSWEVTKDEAIYEESEINGDFFI